MVCRSTQHGLYEAMQRFHPDMPCVRQGLSRHCGARITTSLCFTCTYSASTFLSLWSARSTGHNTPCAELCMRGRRVPSTNGFTPFISVYEMHTRPTGRWFHGNGSWNTPPPPWHVVSVPLQPAFPAGLPSSPVRPPARCLRDRWLLAPAPSLRGRFCGCVPGDPHAGRVSSAHPVPSRQLICSGSVHILVASKACS